MIIELQEALSRENLDGWLFFDHHHRDPLAYQILGLNTEVPPSRRWYYFVPAKGEPVKLVHRIEAQTLDQLTGDKDSYSNWIEQQEKLRRLLDGVQRIAMQYSPNCAIPYISMVDGGTLELIRSFGVEVVSSADLVQEFEACWSSLQLESHVEAGRRVDRVRRDAFTLVGERLRVQATVSEYDVQQFIRARFEEEDLLTDHGPIVAVNQNASDPHYEPSASAFRQIKLNDVLLIDLWAKMKTHNAVYYDVTWTGFCGSVIPSDVQNVFQVVTEARQAASAFVNERISNHNLLFGWEVDDVARRSIDQQGFADFFFHRTGHSIGTAVHGNGANMDNFESHDYRKVISNTCFSIEPGVYLPAFGVRSEVNVFVGEDRAWVTGEEQDRLVCVVG